MQNSSNTRLAGIAIFLLCVAGILWYAISNMKSDTPIPAPTTTTNPVPTTPTVVDTSSTPADVRRTSKYKDGTYTVESSYNSPAGLEKIGISITLKGDLIVDASATNMARDEKSVRYQDKFIGGFKAFIVGKNIDTVVLDRVSGSSLTPDGFNTALTKIKAEARV